MRWIGALLLVICAGLSSAQMPVWRSDRDLLGHAWRVHPHLPRVTLNYGLALLPTDREAGITLLVRAAERAEDSPRAREIRAVVKHRFLWLEAFGDPVCSRPSVQPVCSSF